MQGSSKLLTNNKSTPNFLQAGCPLCRPTNSVGALKGKAGSMDLLISSSSGSFNVLFDRKDRSVKSRKSTGSSSGGGDGNGGGSSGGDGGNGSSISSSSSSSCYCFCFSRMPFLWPNQQCQSVEGQP